MTKDPNIPYPFDETLLDTISLSYRLITPIVLDQIKQAEGLMNFSESEFHKSSNYQKTNLYKPFSTIDYAQFQE